MAQRTKNLKAIRNNGLGFMVTLKSHRPVSLEKNVFLSVKDVDIPSEGLVVGLRELGFVRLYRMTLKNEHRHYALYLPDAAQLGEVTRTEFEAIHDPHWQIEPYHRAIKPVCPIEHSQVRGEASVRNHVFAALSGDIHLQTMCLAELITNTYALQRNLFNEVISEFIGKTASMIKGVGTKI